MAQSTSGRRFVIVPSANNIYVGEVDEHGNTVATFRAEVVDATGDQPYSEQVRQARARVEEAVELLNLGADLKHFRSEDLRVPDGPDAGR